MIPKINVKKIAVPVVIAFGALSGFARAETQTYVMDPAHTSVVFSWNHFGFSNPTADFSNVTGNIVLDDKHITQTKVDVTIPIDSVDTHVQKLTEEFKGKDYFDQATYPQATFHSTKIVSEGAHKYKVYGDLKIKDITKPVILNAVLNKIGQHPMEKKQAVGFNATTTIKRSEFGLDKYVPMVSDAVVITISTEALVK
ncbi:YceI family protein [Sodalis sp. RH15]|jgi:polyisoprenoid-binding protein YceI|uniref:YceI family protein n=1 Tax=Sodalis sp. RH15 TaxID=3394330 RepID=UPI0039B69999